MSNRSKLAPTVEVRDSARRHSGPSGPLDQNVIAVNESPLLTLPEGAAQLLTVRRAPRALKTYERFE